MLAFDLVDVFCHSTIFSGVFPSVKRALLFLSRYETHHVVSVLLYISNIVRKSTSSDHPILPVSVILATELARNDIIARRTSTMRQYLILIDTRLLHSSHSRTESHTGIHACQNCPSAEDALQYATDLLLLLQRSLQLLSVAEPLPGSVAAFASAPQLPWLLLQQLPPPPGPFSEQLT